MLREALETLRSGTDERGFRLPDSSFPMWMFDGRTGRLLAVNEAATRTYGFCRDEMLGKHVDDLCPSLEPGAGLVTYDAKGSPWTGALVQRRKDGFFEAQIAMVETGDRDRPLRMVIALPLSLEARASSRSGVRAKTLLGQAGFPFHLPEADGEGVQSWRGPPFPANVGGHTSMVEVPFLSQNPRWFVQSDPRELVRRVRDAVHELAEAKHVDVHYYGRCSAVRVHPQAFFRALYELTRNAVQACRPGHPVIIDANDTGQGDVLWRIQDAGEGLSEARLAELGQVRRKSPRGRYELGVALAWAIIEAHGGLMHFETEVGVGTTVSILVPNADTVSEAPDLSPRAT